MANGNGVQYEWFCRICGWSIVADEPPEICPQCGAPKQFFEPLSTNEDTEAG